MDTIMKMKEWDFVLPTCKISFKIFYIKKIALKHGNLLKF